jgi:HSP20 family protein
METVMADAPVEVKKSPSQAVSQPSARPPAVPDVWQSFRGEMDRLFDRFSGNFGFPSLRRMFDMDLPSRGSSFGFSVPAIDMTEDETAYKISAELPGLDAKDVDLSVTGDMLVIKGEKRQESEQKDKNYHFSERSYGSFQRAFELPASVDRDKVSASFAKGVLTIELPKTADAQRQPKKIEVKQQA